MSAISIASASAAASFEATACVHRRLPCFQHPSTRGGHFASTVFARGERQRRERNRPESWRPDSYFFQPGGTGFQSIGHQGSEIAALKIPQK